MLSYIDIKKGLNVIIDGQPYNVLEANQLKMQQRRPVMQTRMRNLINGKIIERNFQQSDNLEEADIQKMEVKFIYHSRDEYWFHDINDPSKRFSLKDDIIDDAGRFLKPNMNITAMLFDSKVIKIDLPVKIEFKVTEAPPAIRGNTAQGGTKTVTIETGTTINVPLFINEGDIIRINTQTGDYVERAEKN